MNAYRRVFRAAESASRGEELPSEVRCKGDDEICADPVRALAELPFEALFDVSITSGRFETCRALDA